MRGLGRLAITVAALALWAGPAGAQTYPVTSYVAAHGRGLDQSLHPDYQLRMVPGYQAGATAAPGWERLFFTDPYVAQDGPRRADWLDVSFTNRYGAKLAGTLIAPKGPGPFPILVIEPGGSGPRWAYLNLAQGLAESGYVTLTLAPQGDADADVLPADPLPATPENEYCRPHNYGDWQAGEGGVPESGPCAGQQAETEPASLADVVVASVDADAGIPGLDDAYRAIRARKAFGVLDAVRWLVSPANPWRSRVDPARVGVAGHSFGAQGALIAGQIDSLGLIDAVVAWDNYGPLDSIAPRVPTMLQAAEDRLIGPRGEPSSPDAHPQAGVQAAFRQAGVPSMLVTLAQSTHQEWNYLPYLGLTIGALALAGDPTAAEGAAASSLGERVGLYYTLAWFDRWLKPGLEASARQRLLARQFDQSADRVAIGQGTWNLLARRNVPYVIGGRRTADHLSPMFTSRADFDGISCPSLRTGC